MSTDIARTGQGQPHAAPRGRDEGAADTRAGLGTGTFQQGRNERQPLDQSSLGAFAEELASARRVPAAAKPDDTDLADSVTVAATGVTTGQPGAATPQGIVSQPGVAQLVQKIVTETQAAERLALGNPKGTEITLPITAPMLGIGEARLVVHPGELLVVISAAKAVDQQVLAAAMSELSASLQQRFPNRTVRLSQADDPAAPEAETVEFDPLNQPVKRRAT